MRSKLGWFHPFAWMIGLAAATASAILLLAAIAMAPGASVFFGRLLTDHALQLAVAGNIGCAFVAGLFIAQGAVLLLRLASNRSS